MSSTGAKSKGKKSRNRRKQDKPEEEQTANGAETEVNPEDQLEREVAWCLQQLSIGLQNPKQKISHKQGVQAVEAIRALSNPKTALVKKRQLMRVHFGDYRKKMAQEEKQYYANFKKPTITRSAPPTKSTALKKAAKPAAETESREPQEGPSATGFKFDFKVDSEDKPGGQESAANSETQESNMGTSEPALNYYKMVPTEGNKTFRFNFNTDPE